MDTVDFTEIILFGLKLQKIGILLGSHTFNPHVRAVLFPVRIIMIKSAVHCERTKSSQPQVLRPWDMERMISFVSFSAHELPGSYLQAVIDEENKL